MRCEPGTAETRPCRGPGPVVPRAAGLAMARPNRTGVLHCSRDWSQAFAQRKSPGLVQSGDRGFSGSPRSQERRDTRYYSGRAPSTIAPLRILPTVAFLQINSAHFPLICPDRAVGQAISTCSWGPGRFPTPGHRRGVRNAQYFLNKSFERGSLCQEPSARNLVDRMSDIGHGARASNPGSVPHAHRCISAAGERMPSLGGKFRGHGGSGDLARAGLLLAAAFRACGRVSQ